MPIQCKIVFLKIQTLCDVMLCVVQVVPFMAMDHSAFIFSDKQSKKTPLALKMKMPWSFEMSATSHTTTQHRIPEMNRCAVHICNGKQSSITWHVMLGAYHRFTIPAIRNKCFRIYMYHKLFYNMIFSISSLQ